MTTNRTRFLHAQKHIDPDKDIILPSGFVVNTQFKEMMKRSYDFNESVYNKDSRWSILEELYNKNYINNTSFVHKKIPRKIHQVWLGSELPDKYKRYADTWTQLNPEWEYRLWTDRDCATMNLPNRKLFDSITNYGPKSDLLRFHLLNEYGGLYVDTDFECLKSFERLTYLDFFTGIGYPSKLELYPGLIGCVPNHPIIAKAIEAIKEIKSIPTDATGVLETISSYFFTRIFWQVVSKYEEGIVAFPPDYFYPFPNQRGHKSRSGRDYIKNCSYAIHHWEVAWLK
jgi:mannosyltransferase OCH1-like enzyme